jgi:purine-binding chemotaxis protein CheW
METKRATTNRSYLTFKLGEEQFGISVKQVLNILEMTKITAVPKTPSYMKGIINLRGKVLPVIDTRIKMGLSETVYQKNTCIIVMDLQAKTDTINIGAIVDEVLSVIEIDDDEIQPPPTIGNNFKSEFIYGMAKIEEEFIMLLDMNQIFSGSEISQLAVNESSEPQSIEHS